MEHAKKNISSETNACKKNIQSEHTDEFMKNCTKKTYQKNIQSETLPVHDVLPILERGADEDGEE